MNPEDEIVDRFAHHVPDPDGTAVIVELRRQFSELARHIAETIPNGRSRAVAITHLEDACMWSVKAVVLGR